VIGLLGFNFLRVELWPLFGLVLVFVLLGVVSSSLRRAALKRLSDNELLAVLSANYSRNRARLRLCLEATSAALIVLAILGPVRGYTEIPVNRKGLDIVICLDTSRSMLARDLAPDRLERARREVRGLLENLAGDRVALVAFSGNAREVAPLTRDRNALLSFLDRISPVDNRMGGTSLGAALERSLTIFDGRTGAHEAIVVLTDGEDLEGEGLTVARRAKEQGIGIYVVGLGTEQGGKIPIVGRDGVERFLRGPDGEEVLTRLDRESLAQLATVTDGAFLTTSDSATPLEEIYHKRIGKLDRREMGGGDERVPHDRYQWALVPGVLLALLALGTRERRPARVVSRVLANARRLAGLVMLPLFFAASLGATDGSAQEEVAGSPPSFSDQNPQAAMVLEHVLECVREENFSEALSWLEFSLGMAVSDAENLVAVELDGKEQGAVVDPHERFPWTDLERAHLRYAKGIVLDRLGEIAPALMEFQAAAALAGPGEIRTRGLYNRGTIQLLATEAKRDGFIEESKAQAGGGAPVPSPPPLPGAPDEEPENPIEVLREGYGKARNFLLEHMKLDSSHVDTRANLELIVRRLRELDLIEEQQEDQEQDQEQEEQDGEESEDSEEESDEASEPEEDSPSDEDSQSSEESEEPEDEEGEPEEEPAPSEEEQEQEEAPKEEEPAGAPMQLEDMSPQELARLLDDLSALEEKQAALQKRLQGARQVPVDRDW